MMKLFSVFIYSGFLFSSVACADINHVLNGKDYSESFKESFYQAYNIGPNFNGDDYIFSYGCGGGAICANIYDSQKEKFVDFPDGYLIDSEKIEFELKFSKESSKLCISGESAYDATIYSNVCYVYNDGQLTQE
ncbi:hypothetical protein [Vibrio furnissii]|uniref:hypothetical protein n=1 Tax=Vibrio furnissii TaxID=29494 RepID=UPI001A7E57FE|nr:hypothetical protein [Vibrio furnissii]